jgi:hypothetical protein
MKARDRVTVAAPRSALAAIGGRPALGGARVPGRGPVRPRPAPAAEADLLASHLNDPDTPT